MAELHIGKVSWPTPNYTTSAEGTPRLTLEQLKRERTRLLNELAQVSARITVHERAEDLRKLADS